MEFLGVGPSELVFIIIIAIIVLGPKDMQKAGRTIGRWLNQLIRSDSWKVFQRTSTELRNLPRNLMREANMELQEVDKEIRQTIDPRSRPTAISANQNPTTGTSVPAASDGGEPVSEDRAGQTPLNQTDTPPQPPTIHDAHDTTKQDD